MNGEKPDNATCLTPTVEIHHPKNANVAFERERVPRNSKREAENLAGGHRSQVATAAERVRDVG